MTDENNADVDKVAAPTSVPSPANDSLPAEHLPAHTAPTTPYVRQRPAHRSVEPIDDFAHDDDLPTNIAHDSGFTTGGSLLSGQGYRRSRADSKQLRRDLHYGQYLEIPKGRRDIFASRERKTRLKTFLALVVVLAVLAVVVFFVWEYMQANWGATS